jgi:hypothetical protein
MFSLFYNSIIVLIFRFLADSILAIFIKPEPYLWKSPLRYSMMDKTGREAIRFAVLWSFSIFALALMMLPLLISENPLPFVILFPMAVFFALSLPRAIFSRVYFYDDAIRIKIFKTTLEEIRFPAIVSILRYKGSGGIDIIYTNRMGLKCSLAEATNIRIPQSIFSQESYKALADRTHPNVLSKDTGELPPDPMTAKVLDYKSTPVTAIIFYLSWLLINPVSVSFISSYFFGVLSFPLLYIVLFDLSYLYAWWVMKKAQIKVEKDGIPHPKE